MAGAAGEGPPSPSGTAAAIASTEAASGNCSTSLSGGTVAELAPNAGPGSGDNALVSDPVVSPGSPAGSFHVSATVSSQTSALASSAGGSAETGCLRICTVGCGGSTRGAGSATGDPEPASSRAALASTGLALPGGAATLAAAAAGRRTGVPTLDRAALEARRRYHRASPKTPPASAIRRKEEPKPLIRAPYCIGFFRTAARSLAAVWATTRPTSGGTALPTCFSCCSSLPWNTNPS